MNLSQRFIERPVGTTLLAIAVAIAGAIAFGILPVAPLPQVDFPTISVSAGLPGASADIMASSVATPLERQFSHIAGVSEMTSASSLGSTQVTLQFDLSRDIDGAARDVEAAINASRSYLPANLPGNPTYRKVNPADSPIMILGLTSDKYAPAQMYDAASTVIEQKLSQIAGVGQVNLGGGALPAVRVDANPAQLAHYGLSIANLQTVLSAQNANLPKGQLSNGDTSADILANDQITGRGSTTATWWLATAREPRCAWRMSRMSRTRCRTSRAAGYLNGKRAVMLIIFRQPGANIIQTVDAIRAQLPIIKASINRGIDITVVLDRTTTIRASVRDVEKTLITSTLLVVLVVFLFLRNVRSTFIPGIAMPVSLIGTCAVMYLFDYSIDNLSLMALTIATGFVVDDAIVVMENITRHVEAGMKPMAAALKGAEEIGSTVFTISVSLVAVFIPLLLMGGIVGRLFREFAVTLSAAIIVSMITSLTLTPMMCAYLLKNEKQHKHGRLYQFSERSFDAMLSVLPAHPALGAGSSRHYPGRLAVYGGAQRGPGDRDSQGILSAAGHRAAGRRRAGSPGHLFWRHGGFAAAHRGGIERGPGGGQRRRLHRRRCDQHRQRIRLTQAARDSARPALLPSSHACGRSSTACRWPQVFLQAQQDVRIGGRSSATPCTSTPCSRTTSPTSPSGGRHCSHR